MNAHKGPVERKVPAIVEPALQQKAPGTFFWVGAGNEEKGITFPHHHPQFTIDEDALPIGVKMFLNATFKLLDNGAPQT